MGPSAQLIFNLANAYEPHIYPNDEIILSMVGMFYYLLYFILSERANFNKLYSTQWGFDCRLIKVEIRNATFRSCIHSTLGDNWVICDSLVNKLKQYNFKGKKFHKFINFISKFEKVGCLYSDILRFLVK